MAKTTSDPAPRSLGRLDALSKILLSAATLVLSAVIGFATLYYNQRTAQLQIQNQIDALELQKRATAAEILVNQLSTILRGSEEERNLTLKLLEVVDPDLVRQIGERLLAQAESPAEEKRAEAIIASSVQATQEQAVPQHLENARKFLEFRAWPAAAREYLKAYEALPAERRALVSEEAEEARRLYDAGDFAGAVDAFARAFEGLEKGAGR